VVDDDDVADKQDAGTHGVPAAACEFLGPLEGAAAELEAVEIDAAEPQDGRPEHVAHRSRLLLDHPVLGERAQDAVDGGVGQAELGSEVAEAHPAGALEGEQDADGAVDGLDHVASDFREVS
jgi:hypothetical protein